MRAPRPRRIDWHGWRIRVAAQQWKLALLILPFIRTLFYITGLAPLGISELHLPRFEVTFSVVLLGVSALTAGVAAVLRSPLIERAALTVLAPAAFSYGVMQLIANFKVSLVAFVIYSTIAAVSVARVVEINHAIRTTVRMLGRAQSRR